ncbi:M1 family metallopeptidase [soil metagenome]
MIRKIFSALSLALSVAVAAGCRVQEPASASVPMVEEVPVVPQAPADSVPAPVATGPVWNPKRNNYQPAATRVHDLLHTRLRIRFDWARKHVLGEATLTLKPYFYPQAQLVLDARGFDIHKVSLVSKQGEKDLKFAYDQRKLTITLDRTYTRQETYQVLIRYTAKPNELEVTTGEAITADRGLYFINPLGEEPNKPRQIWTQGETESNSAWFPTIDSPNERMSQEVYLTVDPRYVTLSNGRLISSTKNADGTRTDYWKQDLPHAPYLVMVAVGEYAIIRDKWRGKEVNYYVEPAYASSARAIFGNTPEMMEFFSRKLGVDYPWDKYSQIVVRDYVSGAMENTSASVFMEALQMTRRELIDKSWDDIIAHELFHQWFGDLVTAEAWSQLPLNEAFANYAPYLWAEHKLGPEAAALNRLDELGQYLAEAQGKQVPMIRYHYNDPQEMFDSHSYAKGGLVLHMLRKYVGDEAFFASLNKYLTTHTFTSVEIDELRMAFEDVTGEDLNWFFDQWFLSAGHPHLLVNHNFQDGKLVLEVQQLQDTVATPVYRLPLTVSVWAGGKKTDHRIEINQMNQVVELPAPTRPDLVLFDGEQQLVGVIEHAKSEQELLFQFYQVGHYEPRHEAIDRLTENITNPEVLKMMRAALQDPFWSIRVQALQAFEKYSGPQAVAVREEVSRMARADKNSTVRASTLYTLTSFGTGEYADLYRQALQDSSFLVVAAAINAYGSARRAEALPAFVPLEAYDNAHVVNALAGYYAVHGGPGKYAWYLEKFTKLSGLDLYYFLQNLGGFLTKVPEEQQGPAVQRIADIAQNHPTYYLRFAAYQALTTASDSEQMNQLRQSIREKEQDPRLRQLYSIMP